MKLKFPLIVLFFSVSLFLSCSASAHPGRTDENGGHTERATGEYHYHHGYEAHQHIGGVCPFDFDDQSKKGGSTTTPSKAEPIVSYSGSNTKSSIDADAEPDMKPAPASEPERSILYNIFKFVMTHLYLIPITPIALLILCGSIYRIFDNIIDKRCDTRVKAAIEAQEKDLQEKKARFEAYMAEEEQHMKHLHQAVNNALQIGFTEAPKQATEEFTQELSIRFLRSRISHFCPNLFPSENPLLWPDALQDRLFRSVRDNIRIKDYHIQAEIIGSSGSVYTTTLTSCSCPDFTRHKPQPCKHIIYLHMHLGHAVCDGKQIEDGIKQLQQIYDAAPKPKKKT